MANKIITAYCRNLTAAGTSPCKTAGKVEASYAIIEGTGGDIMINNLTGVISK
jgi:hypothetical protein